MSRVELHRAYKFRLYPTSAQIAELSEWERQLRRLWNFAQEQRLISLQRHTRPKSPGIVECRGCGAPSVDESQHNAGCAGVDYHRSKTSGAVECSNCGARKVVKTDHTSACHFTDYYRQGREMTEIVRADDQLARVVCSARQEILRDLEKAWQRWRKGLGGKPRFKCRIDSCRVYFSTPKAWKVEAGHLSFTGAATSVGRIRIKQDRVWPGDAKFSSCHVVRDGDEWYAVFPLTFSVEVKKPKGGAVGINRGAVHAIADSNGRVVDSPKFYARALGVIRHRARLLDRKVPFGRVANPSPTKYRGLPTADVDALAKEVGTSPGRVVYEASKRGGLEAARVHLTTNAPTPQRDTLVIQSDGRNRERARQYLARAHQRVRRQREWFLHNESAHYTRNFSKIAIEDWSTKEMTSSEPQESDDGTREARRVTRGRNRAILDVGWYELGRQIAYKSESTGAEVVKVDPGLRETESFLKNREAIEGRPDPTTLLKGLAGISGTCSSCGAVLAEAASGHREAICDVCARIGSGDVNAAVNVLKRAMFQKPGDVKTPEREKVTIGIKGRKKRAA